MTTNPNSHNAVRPKTEVDPYTLEREVHINPDGWRGVYVEFDPKSQKVLVYGQDSFFQSVATPESLWSAVVAARDLGHGVLRKEDLVPRLPFDETKRQEAIDAWLEENPPILDAAGRRKLAAELRVEDLDL